MRQLISVGAVVGCSHPAAMKTLTGCLANGEQFEIPLNQGGVASFRSAFDGYGCNSVAERDGAAILHLRSGQAIHSDQTHASLILGPMAANNLDLSCGVTTQLQTRLGSSPNNHEVGWLVWNYTDNDHFYYLTAKPTGWELGRRDPAYPGGQKFLATETTPRYPVGLRHELRVTQSRGTIDAWIDGEHVTTYTDGPEPYTQGAHRILLRGLGRVFRRDQVIFGIGRQPLTIYTMALRLSSSPRLMPMGLTEATFSGA